MSLRDHDAVEALVQVSNLKNGGHQRLPRLASRTRTARQMSLAGDQPLRPEEHEDEHQAGEQQPLDRAEHARRQVRKLIACGSACSSNAPTTGPQVVRMPPTTTMVRIAEDCRISNCSGAMKRK